MEAGLAAARGEPIHRLQVPCMVSVPSWGCSARENKLLRELVCGLQVCFCGQHAAEGMETERKSRLAVTCS